MNAKEEMRKSGREQLTQRQRSCTRALKLFSVELMLASVCSRRINFQMDVEICILWSAVVLGY